MVFVFYIFVIVVFGIVVIFVVKDSFKVVDVKMVWFGLFGFMIVGGEVVVY